MQFVLAYFFSLSGCDAVSARRLLTVSHTCVRPWTKWSLFSLPPHILHPCSSAFSSLLHISGLGEQEDIRTLITDDYNIF